MWFSFPIGGRVRVGVPWWLLPFALVAYLTVVIVLLPIWRVARLLQAATRPRRRHDGREAEHVRVTVRVSGREKPQSETQRPGEMG